ncbi:signal peptide peptidase SppA [Coralliovum pocilloporae]|uniref:signal peptide peptidase SppA n=1 Tax=Coralliovum pocilloporae TaxID=3066369 RepID=UPI0033078B48
MSLDLDAVLDRRRLRRKLTVWRVIAFALVAGLIVVAASSILDQFGGDHVARVSIHGFISEDPNQLAMLKQIEKDKKIKAVIVSIDSPGGSTAGGEALYEALRRIAEKKPMVATMSTVAASAGYMVALASDHILARRTTITGSIGVIFQSPDASKLLNTVGISFEEIKSSPLKAEPDPLTPTTDEAREMVRSVILDTYDWFVDLVAERRPFDRDTALALADGRIFSGRQAVEARLVDAIGAQEEARDWLNTEHKVATDLPLRDWKPHNPEEEFGFLGRALTGIREISGLSGLLGQLSQQFEGIKHPTALDGLRSVWQPQPSQGE